MCIAHIDFIYNDKNFAIEIKRRIYVNFHIEFSFYEYSF